MGRVALSGDRGAHVQEISMMKRQVGRSLLIVSILVVTSSAVWAEGKEPWELTLEERLERRFDPKVNTQRVPGAVGGVDLEKNVVSVDGARQPELLMPYELFQGLLRRVYGPQNEMNLMYRERYTPLLQGLEIDEKTFWVDLERISEDLLRVDKEKRALAVGLESMSEEKRHEVLQQIDRVQESYCTDRVRVLSEAERFFGKEKFYRFLYEGVAKTMAITSLSSTPEQMRFIAGGCQ